MNEHVGPLRTRAGLERALGEIAQLRAFDLPAPVGPYSPGMQFERLIFVSGQGATDPATGKLAGPDAVLELRHGAGRRDAVGNRGMTLYRSDLNPLLARVGLVIDNQQVPITHAIEDYYAPERLRDTLGAMAFLRDPNLPAAKASLPG